MADPLSVAASIIAVVQISQSVVCACYDYVQTANNAEKDIMNTINIVSGLKIILDRLKNLVEKENNFATQSLLKQLDAQRGPIHTCKTALQEIESRLVIKSDSKLVRAIKWPWISNEIKKILETIEKEKGTLILILQADVRDSVCEIVRDENFDRVIRWLSSPDPSSNHNSARKKCERTTGDWFIESQDFESWTTQTASSLWLYGIPGSGKTILCSTIIENVMSLCANSAHEYAYFYFDFNDPLKRSTISMLRSIVTQLCSRRQRIPSEVYDLYQRCDKGNIQPSQDGLLRLLCSILSTTHRTFIVLDALDESLEKDELFQALKKFSGTVNLLDTSRKEKDITEELKELIETAIGLEEGIVDRDIQIHVKKCLVNDKRFKNGIRR